MKDAVFKRRNIKSWLRYFSFFIAPAGGLLGIVFCVSLEFGFWRTAPHTARSAGPILMFLLFAFLLALYAVFITMIMTWDIDRISYAVEEEAERQLLKRISSDKQKSPQDTGQSDPGKAAAGRAPLSGALETERCLGD